MSTKPLLYAVFALLVMSLGSATAGETATNAAKPASIYRNAPSAAQILNGDVLPVLVRVNDQGAIGYMSSAYELRPQYERMLRKTLDEMITAPARNKSGQAIASEFIIYVTARTTPRKDGKYDFGFTYVSARPVPFGNWIWGQYDSGRLALLSPDINNNFDRWGFPYRRYWNDTRYDACYYDGRTYPRCAIYDCIANGSCDKDSKSDKNNKDDDKSKATGTVIRAASTGVQRFRRPRLALRAHGMLGRSTVYAGSASRATRYGPAVTPWTHANPAAAPTVPSPWFDARGGRQAGPPPAPVSRSANIP